MSQILPDPHASHPGNHTMQQSEEDLNSHLQGFAFAIQAAAEALVVGRQRVQLRAQGVVRRGRSLGDEAVHVVRQQLDLLLLGVHIVLRCLVEKQRSAEKK